MITTRPTVTADGCTWSIDTFIDAYRYTRATYPGPDFPRAYDFMALMDDGRLLGPLAGYEIAPLVGRGLVAWLYLAGGADDQTFAPCTGCHATAVLLADLCAACDRAANYPFGDVDDDDEDERRCPRCGHAL